MTHYDPIYDFRVSVTQGTSPYFHHEVPEFAPPLARYEEQLHTLYHACLDALTPPEPVEITQQSQVSAWMLQWGNAVSGRDLGQGVQRWRDSARAGAHQELRSILEAIEQEMKA